MSKDACAPRIVRARPHRHVHSIDPDHPPPRVDRADASVLLLARLGFKISPRTLQTWPLPTERINGRATYNTAELLAVAMAKIERHNSPPAHMRPVDGLVCPTTREYRHVPE